MKNRPLAYGLVGLALTSLPVLTSANAVEQCFAKAITQPCQLITQAEFDKLSPDSIKAYKLKAQAKYEEADPEDQIPAYHYCAFEPTENPNRDTPLMGLSHAMSLHISVEAFNQDQLQELPPAWQQKLQGKSTKEIFNFLMEPGTRKQMMLDVILQEDLSAQELEMAKAMVSQMPEPKIQPVKNLAEAGYWEVIDFGIGSQFGHVSVLQGQHILNIELEHGQAEEYKNWLINLAKSIVNQCKK
ncbi:hypothetical protein JX580_05260 [Thiomicrospira microaerophila]|uniref:hypothetical protein n=1 Tax=Thiomicrospira microaerophila TaxID=406020 RepID=UPI00200FF376|nr:hypothetical protein [Thiomicrospira microaerophila]UQB43284.1 hypothetical protein JX580_05260 [Thiomicrospira microaerophila]